MFNRERHETVLFIDMVITYTILVYQHFCCIDHKMCEPKTKLLLTQKYTLTFKYQSNSSKYSFYKSVRHIVRIC